MKRYRIIFILSFVVSTCFSQEIKKEYKIHTIAFYNLENLFDTINDPNTKDESSPIMLLKTSRSKAYYDKINNIEVEAYLSGSLLECKPENPKLKEKEVVVRCTLEEGIGKDVPPYTTLLTIDIKYGYTETISQNIEIRKET